MLPAIEPIECAPALPFVCISMSTFEYKRSPRITCLCGLQRKLERTATHSHTAHARNTRSALKGRQPNDLKCYGFRDDLVSVRVRMRLLDHSESFGEAKYRRGQNIVDMKVAIAE